MRKTDAIVMSLLLLSGACVETDESPPPEDVPLDESGLLPDGAHGVTTVIWNGERVEIPFVARDGLAWIDDDVSVGPAISHPKSERAAPNGSFNLWDGSVVPYCMHDMSSGEKDDVQAALATFASLTPLTFEKHSCSYFSSSDRYVDFYVCSSCSSSSTNEGDGHNGKTIKLRGGFSATTVWHETGHAVGLMHEQRRTDRNTFLNYYDFCDAAPDQYAQSFDLSTIQYTPYDRTSIMEYASGDLSVIDTTSSGGCPVILWKFDHPDKGWPVPGSYFQGEWITRPLELSDEDVNALAQRYEPALGVCEQNDGLGGAAMATGDFDDDGYDDLAVGAIGEGPNGSSVASGAVFVYKGTMNGLVAWKVLSELDFAGSIPQTGDGFGSSLAAQDYDNDGDVDLVVGAQLYGSPRGGAVFVYEAKREGLVPRGTFGILTQWNTPNGGVESGDLYGAAVTIGKFTGSSQRWLAVGAPYEAPVGGQVDLYFWNGTYFQYNYTLTAGAYAASGIHFGATLADGDLNDDGYRDLVVGAPQELVGSGRVFPFFGRTLPLEPKPSFTGLAPSTNDRFGASLAVGNLGASAGDSIVIGAPGRISNQGSAYAFSFRSSTGKFDWDKTFPAQSGATGDEHGTRVAIGDIDGDGAKDVVVSAPGHTVSGQAQAGQVVAFLATGTNKLLNPPTPQAFDRHGTSLAIGNFDHGANGVMPDDIKDVATGAPGRSCDGASGSGSLHIYRGGSTLDQWRFFNQTTHDGP